MEDRKIQGRQHTYFQKKEGNNMYASSPRFPDGPKIEERPIEIQ